SDVASTSVKRNVLSAIGGTALRPPPHLSGPPRRKHNSGHCHLFLIFGRSIAHVRVAYFRPMPNLENRRALFLMQHKGIPYRIVQTSNPTGWKWTIEIPGKPHKSGQAINRT